MLKVVLSCLMVLGFCFNASAEADPFAHCDQMRSELMKSSCDLAVADSFIQEQFGKRALNKATRLASKECVSNNSRKLDPKLSRLVNLQCQVEFKINLYNSLVDAAEAQ